MRKTAKSSGESGHVIVEATILIPFCLLMVFALYYAALFLCQKANLQANVQNALIYYKNACSDTYVEASDHMAYGTAGETIAAAGSRYGEPSYLFPYRFLFGIGSDSSRFNQNAFASFFRSMCGAMFFDDGSNVRIEAKESNYVVYRTITATGTLTLSASGTAVVSDGEDFIRNVDFAVDIVQSTSLGKKAGELVEAAKDFYDKFKSKFGIG